jgi:hypothetical protein
VSAGVAMVGECAQGGMGMSVAAHGRHWGEGERINYQETRKCSCPLTSDGQQRSELSTIMRGRATQPCARARAAPRCRPPPPSPPPPPTRVCGHSSPTSVGGVALHQILGLSLIYCPGPHPWS